MTAAGRAAQVEEITDFLSEYVAAVNSADLASIVTYYTDDPAFHWVENGRVAYESHEAVRRTFEALQPNVAELRLTITEPRIEPLGPDAATVTASYSQLFVDKAGTRYATGGMLTAALVRRGGRWGFLSGHLSQPRPPSS